MNQTFNDIKIYERLLDAAIESVSQRQFHGSHENEFPSTSGSGINNFQPGDCLTSIDPLVGYYPPSGPPPIPAKMLSGSANYAQHFIGQMDGLVCF